jgi:hypothetical protein
LLAAGGKDSKPHQLLRVFTLLIAAVSQASFESLFRFTQAFFSPVRRQIAATPYSFSVFFTTMARAGMMSILTILSTLSLRRLGRGDHPHTKQEH